MTDTLTDQPTDPGAVLMSHVNFAIGNALRPLALAAHQTGGTIAMLATASKGSPVRFEMMDGKFLSTLKAIVAHSRHKDANTVLQLLIELTPEDQRIVQGIDVPKVANPE